ncbi:hypothetical protein Q0590_33690 [Rhodocytophaga aerolata]|uniref:Uncharacterized protein n=1 Tax=Rhodocytophaga aerolata TaxID=455078 RepID=A0ABT8RGQ1_9BACT|nr:hypothetical protein [Rhodocytophaga aerolata]MDO1451276.1 hypothetical protein [Rhodocytophaga aerolata]
MDPKLLEEFTISSVETGRNYKISIRLPEQYYDSDEKYSILYVLDSKQDKDKSGRVIASCSSSEEVKEALICPKFLSF